MPDYWLTLSDPHGDRPPETRQVRLNKLPKQGSWFDIGGGVPAHVTRLMIESGEPVIYADLGTDADRSQLKPKHG